MIKTLKNVLPKSISARFFLILITPVVLSQLIFSSIFFGKYTDKVMTNMSDQIAGDIHVIKHSLENNSNIENTEFLSNNFKIKIERADSFCETVKSNNRTLKILSSSLKKLCVTNFCLSKDKKNIIVFLKLKNSGASFKLSFDKQKLYTRIIPIVLGWGISSSIILLIIAFIFLKNQIRPIKRLAKAAKQFGKEIDNNIFVPEGAKEIRMAGIAFCEMKTNLRNLLNERLKTLAGISHDLKTPLTKMKLQLSLMPKNKEVYGLIQDVLMMIEITKSFTVHANEQLKETFSSRNLFSFLFEVSKDFENDKFKVNIDGDKKIEVSIKYVSFKRAFSNIFANAKKYASNLYISFEKKNNEVKIVIEDDGPGIKQEFWETIFSPFVSGNSSRTQNNTANVGLGLSIARDAITSHGGKISACNSKKYKGAKFIVYVPFN